MRIDIYALMTNDSTFWIANASEDFGRKCGDCFRHDVDLRRLRAFFGKTGSEISGGHVVVNTDRALNDRQTEPLRALI